jgi:hypothetical protein
VKQPDLCDSKEKLVTIIKKNVARLNSTQLDVGYLLESKSADFVIYLDHESQQKSLKNTSNIKLGCLGVLSNTTLWTFWKNTHYFNKYRILLGKFVIILVESWIGWMEMKQRYFLLKTFCLTCIGKLALRNGKCCPDLLGRALHM